ncbi:MAG: bis(5'-nucleosyl)-tetraphosphatase (symmetrical) YqeK [candidate division FCPU426 bacterium]
MIGAALARRVRPWLTSRRFAHARGTAGLAARLARRHGLSPERASTLGWLHDVARDLPERELRSLLRRYRGRHCPAATRSNPRLWHNPAGAYLARRRFGLRDPLLLRAIALHSTGAARPTAWDKLIFIADYSEPGRTYPGTAALRRLAEKDLDAAARRVLQAKLAYLRKAGLALHPYTRQMARHYRLPVQSHP